MSYLRPALFLCVCLLGGIARSEAPRAAAAPPNFVFVLADDLGWNNTQVPAIRSRPETASDYYQTPNLVRLAAAGMTFSQAYSPDPVCSPSRHAIQFGMTPAQLKKTSNRAARYPEPFEARSIPQLLKAAHPEYRAAHFGKWHMHRDPSQLGYDASDGRTGNRTGRQLSLDQTKFWPHEDPKLIVSVTDRSIRFIEREAAAGHPFFLQISHYAIHLSAEARPASLEKHEARAPGSVHTAHWYAAMIDDLDHAVGRILDTLEAEGLAANTYVFFTSDNGGTAREFPDINRPLRAGKGSLYEGGIRVPLFVAGPGIPPGSRSAVPVVGYDLLPTFLDLAGGSPALPPRVEGGSLKPVLLDGGRGSVRRPRQGIHFFRPPDSVLIDGRWKLKRSHRSGALELFDLDGDLSESHDLADSRPDVAQAMQQRLEEWIQAIDARTPAPGS